MMLPEQSDARPYEGRETEERLTFRHGLGLTYAVSGTPLQISGSIAHLEIVATCLVRTGRDYKSQPEWSRVVRVLETHSIEFKVSP